MRLTDSQRVYLDGTVMRDLHRKRTALLKFAPRPGQDSALFLEARTKLAKKVKFLEALITTLRAQEAPDDNNTRRTG